MTTEPNKSTRLQDLTTMRLAIEDCRNRHPEMEWDSMVQRANDMVREEQHRLGYMAVYPIVDGCSCDAVYEATPEHCDIYVSIARENDPSKEFIILPI